MLLRRTAGRLDTPTQAIFAILDDLRRDGVTVLLATHDLDLAAERFPTASYCSTAASSPLSRRPCAR